MGDDDCELEMLERMKRKWTFIASAAVQVSKRYEKRRE